MPPYSCRNPVILVEFWQILVDWDLAEGPANLFILVLSILVDSGIYTGMFPGMVFPGMGRNGIPLEWFICLLFICHG